MDFSLGEEREQLAASLRRCLADRFNWAEREATLSRPHGHSPALWADLAGLGAIGALFAEEVGGYGGSGVDIGVVFAELGRALVPSPALAVLLGGQVLAAAGRGELLAQVIAGEAVITLAHEPGCDAEGGELPGISAAQGPGGLRLTGWASVVPFAGLAQHLVVAGQDQGAPALFLLAAAAPGVTITGYGQIDHGSAAELQLENAPAELLLRGAAAAAALASALASAHVALAWESVAVMDVMREQTLDYLRNRKQFGQAIGKFQAVQHRMATLALEIEQMRSAAIGAAVALAAEPRQRDLAGAAARITLGDVGQLVAEEAIQLHGGIGMTWELPLSHYARRLVMMGHQLGDTDAHLSRYIALGRAERVQAA